MFWKIFILNKGLKLYHFLCEFAQMFAWVVFLFDFNFCNFVPCVFQGHFLFFTNLLSFYLYVLHFWNNTKERREIAVQDCSYPLHTCEQRSHCMSQNSNGEQALVLQSGTLLNLAAFVWFYLYLFSSLFLDKYACFPHQKKKKICMFWKKFILSKGLANKQCHYQFLHQAQVNVRQKMGCLPHFLYWASLSIVHFWRNGIIWRRKKGQNITHFPCISINY